MSLGQLSLSQTYACITGKPRTALAEARLAVGSLKILTGDKNLTRKDEFFFFPLSSFYLISAPHFERALQRKLITYTVGSTSMNQTRQFYCS